MNTLKSRRKDDSTLVTPGENLDIRCAMDFYADLDKALARKPGKIMIDAVNLNYTDTATLQLLIAYTLEAKRLNKSVSWLNVNKEFHQCVQYTGTSEILGIR